MKSGLVVSCPVWGLLLLTAAPVAAGWNGSLALTSDYVERGLTQSDGQPALQGGAGYAATQGWRVGLWASLADSDRDGPRRQGGEVELDVVAGYRQPLAAGLALDLRAGRYSYLDDGNGGDYGYSELALALDLRERLRLAVAWSPDAGGYAGRATRGQGRWLIYEASLHWPLGRGWSLFGGAGHADLSDLVGTRYDYWSAGLSLHQGRWVLDLTRVGTDTTARYRFGEELAGDRSLLTLSRFFGGS